MKKRWLRNRWKIGMIWCLLIVLSILGIVYFSHPVQSAIPLGYDAGLYKSLVEAYSQQMQAGRLSVGDWSTLPVWMQHMYPPMVGMLGGLIAWLSWASGAVVGNRLVLWWVSLLTIGLIGSMSWYALAAAERTLKHAPKKYSAGLLTAAFASVSMVVYSLYWRGYIKQLLAGMLLVITIVLLTRKRYFLVWVTALSAMITQRPAIVLCAVVLGLAWLFAEEKHNRVQILLAWGCAVLGAVVIYGGLIDYQFTQSLIVHVLSSIDMPTMGDGFQAWGTFLTTGEYFQVNWPILVLGVLGTMSVLWTRSVAARVHGVLIAFLLLWVFGQGFFFQRMFGYLDMLLLVSIGWWVSVIRERLERKQWRRIVWGFVGLLWVVQAVISFVYRERVRAPIIEAEEFGFIQEIDALVETGSVMIVPSENYSPWLEWWTDTVVVAPGLFDTNKRWRRSEARQQNWWLASAEEKCLAVSRDFGTTNMYVRVWSKQTQITDMTGACFGLIKAWEDPFFALYRLDFDE